MLKILCVTNNYTPYTGGVVSSIQSCTSTLEKARNYVLIATLDFTKKNLHDSSNVQRIYSPVKFCYKSNHMAIPWRSTHQLHNLISTFKPDIIHVHHPFLLGQAAQHIAKKLHMPIVFTYHTMYEHYLHYIPLPEWISKIALQWRLKSFCNAVNGIIAPSSTIAQRVKAIAPHTPVTVIASSLQPPFLPSTEFALKSPKKPFKLLLVGRLVKEKNIPFLLDLFATLDQHNFQLTIIGYGAETDALQGYAYNKLKISKKALQFIIQPPKELIAHWYRQADLFVFPSFSDTQGIVLAEAMAAGTPVVAIDGAGQRDIIKQGINGYIAQSVHEMRNYISLIAHDPALHQQLQYNAWQTAQEFMPDNTTKKLISWYQYIIDNH